MVEDKVQFGEVGEEPFLTVNKFHSQFQLKWDGYRDNNNFVQVNVATSSDTRNPLKIKDVEYVFLNSVLGPVWESDVWIMPQIMSDDGGLTFKDVTDQVIFGAYFFLDDV